MAWYRSLFAGAAPDDLCGESSTHYSKLPTYPSTIERMRAHLPTDLKIIYIMRHPIDRLISQYIHEWTQQVVDGSIDDAIESNPEMIAYSRYAMQLQPFIDAWGRDNILPLFFERFTSHQQQTLERACAFIGYAGRPQWDASLGEQNVSSERLRTSPLRDAIVNLPGLATLRRNLVPRTWRERVKRAWMMKQRPELSESNITRLRRIFDADLAQLGHWLGIDGLTCETFKQHAQVGHPAWRMEAKAPAA
jgi:hypothetical protein